MIGLPSPEVLAGIVSGITETMFGMSFVLADGASSDAPKIPTWRTVVLPIPGRRPLSVAIASDEASGQTLGSAMFSCPVSEVDREMAEDSLRELVNIVAGQVKSAMGVDDALGLPKMLATGEGAINSDKWRGATMRSGTREVMVWVAVSET